MDPNEENFERHTQHSDIEAFQDSQKHLEAKVAHMDTKFDKLYNLFTSLLPASPSQPPPVNNNSAHNTPTPSSSK